MNERATFWGLPLGNLNISRKLSVIVTTTTKKIKIKSLRISYLSNFWNFKKITDSLDIIRSIQDHHYWWQLMIFITKQFKICENKILLTIWEPWKIFFFLISKNDIYTKGYSMHEKHITNPKITRRKKQRKYIKENQATD